MKANWSTHIPLNTLSTTTLLAVASSSKDDSYQNVSISDSGGLKLVAPKLNEKEEVLMSPQDWLHAHPRLIACIRQFLPGSVNEVADMWASHFNLIYNRVNFFLKFHLYLVYNIRLHRRYVYDTSFNPATWQSAVWDQIVEDARTKHIVPLQSTSSSASGAVASSSRPVPKGDSSFRASSAQRPSSASAPRSRFRCIFCGSLQCINRSSCGATLTNFLSLSNGVWQTASGEQVCFRFNSRGCAEPSCARKHLCSRCGSSHSAQDCSL